MQKKAARKRVSPVSPVVSLGMIDDRPEHERRAQPLDAPIAYTLGELAVYVPTRKAVA